MEIKYRWIDGPESNSPTAATEAEWAAVDAILQSKGWPALNRLMSRILLAEDEGNIVGFSVLQMLPNCGPLYVDKGQRGTGVADDLAAKTIQFLSDSKARGWVVIADSPHSEKLARDNGMVKSESPLYVPVIPKETIQ